MGCGSSHTSIENYKSSCTNDTTGNAFIDEALETHNRLRALHGSQPLKHASDLSDYSQKWANDLAKHDIMQHSNCTLPSGELVGENIFCCWSSDTTSEVNGELAVQSWYDEIEDYDYNNPHRSIKPTGHFTQVVWRGTTELGIAWAQAAGGTFYVVANYRPPGNYVGDHGKHVLPRTH